MQNESCNLSAIIVSRLVGWRCYVQSIYHVFLLSVQASRSYDVTPLGAVAGVLHTRMRPLLYTFRPALFAGMILLQRWCSP